MTTYTTNLKLTQPALGATGWGSTVNNGITALVDDAVAGLVSVDLLAGNVTLTTANGTTDQARNMFIRAFGASVAQEVIVPALTKLYFVVNDCTADVTFKVSGQTGVAVPAGKTAVLRCDGTDIVPAVTFLTELTSGSTVTGTKFIPTGNVTAGNGMYLPTTNTLAWSTNGAEGMRLDASGNVSIGTTGGDFSRTWRMVARNDQDAITEIGVINASTGASSAARIAKIGGTTNNFANWELVENSGTPYDAFFYGSAVDHVRWDFAGSERMRITSAGNLGVGASPTANERIRAEGSEARIRSRNSTSGTEVYVGAMSPDEARVWASTNSPLTFGTNDTERARITSAGNVGIGTSSPAASLDVNGGVRAIQGLPTNDNSNVGFSFGPDGDTGLFSPTTGGSASGTLVFLTNSTESARITNVGDLLVGTSTTGGGYTTNSLVTIQARTGEGAQILINDSGSAQWVQWQWNKGTTGDNLFTEFGTEGTFTGRGSILYNRAGGLVAYNTTSDYRAKDILGPVANPGATIDALKVYTGKMKGATVERPMLVAHEAQAVAPYSVTGEKDEVNEDGTPKYQQMDVSALVPLLIAEIQSLRARVAALESK
jgi:hypothetical protein